MQRLLLSLLSVAMLLPAESGAVVPVGLAGSTHVSQRPVPYSKREKTRKYVDIIALKEALDGARLHDAGCLLIAARDCECMALADEENNVKFIHIRVNSQVDKSKRRAVLTKMLSTVREQLTLDESPKVWTSDDATVALLCYAPLDQNEGDDMLGKPRCEALQNLLMAFDESTLELVHADGFACAFKTKKEGVEMEIAVDVSAPIVRYIELRGGKVRAKVNPKEVIESVFPALSEKPSKDNAFFGKGAYRLRALTTDGQYHLCRNTKPKSRFFAAGDDAHLKAAVEREANFKTYGFSEPPFSDAVVSWPDSLNADDLMKQSEAEEDTPEQEPDTPAKQGDEAPQPDKTEAQQDAPAADPEPTAPLTPEAARAAYLKMLREM